MITLSYADDEVSLDIGCAQHSTIPEILAHVATLLRVAGYQVDLDETIEVVGPGSGSTDAVELDLFEPADEVLFDE